MCRSAELDQRRPVGLGKREPDRVTIDDLERGPWLEVDVRAGAVRLTDPGILVPVELDDLGVEDLPVVKGHPLAELELDGAVVEPAPAGGQARDQIPGLVDLDEVLEDVHRDPGPVVGVRVDDPQLPPRRGTPLAESADSPPEDAEPEDETPEDALAHG